MPTNGNDVITGTLSSETIDGLLGDDVVRAGEGNDTVYGRGGADELFGDGGKDRLWGGDGDDTLDGGAGNDLLYGEAGDDALYGGASGDTLRGGDGLDILVGEGGNDVLLGDAGNDWLAGHQGSDVLYGGTGRDLFSYGIWLLDGVRGGANVTTIGDFVRGEDKIEVAIQTDHDVVFLGIDRFDSNRDGALGVGDRGVSLQSVTLNGQARSSLVIDMEATRVASFDSFSPGTHTITVFGQTRLGAADLVPTGEW